MNACYSIETGSHYALPLSTLPDSPYLHFLNYFAFPDSIGSEIDWDLLHLSGNAIDDLDPA
jgi:hypothetical protein